MNPPSKQSIQTWADMDAEPINFICVFKCQHYLSTSNCKQLCLRNTEVAAELKTLKAFNLIKDIK